VITYISPKKKKSPNVLLTNNDSENLHGGGQEWNQDRAANETRLNDGRDLAAGYPVQAAIQLVEIGNIRGLSQK
jgi:hypothetical protein